MIWNPSFCFSRIVENFEKKFWCFRWILWRRTMGGRRSRFEKNMLKTSFTRKNAVAQVIASKNAQKLTSRPYFGMISIPFGFKKPRPDRQNHQNCPTTFKFNQNRPKYFLKNVKSTVASKLSLSVALIAKGKLGGGGGIRETSDGNTLSYRLAIDLVGYFQKPL